MALEFLQRPLDELLGLDQELIDPDDHAQFGYAPSSGVELLADALTPIQLADCMIYAFHRSDDQSEAVAGGMDLEFETPQGDWVVDLEEFVEHRLRARFEQDHCAARVIALCNPDRMDLQPYFAALARRSSTPIYWPLGVVQASQVMGCPHPRLHAQAWRICPGR